MIDEEDEDPGLYEPFERLAKQNQYQVDCHREDKEDPDMNFQYPDEQKVSSDHVRANHYNADQLLAFIGDTVVRTKTKCSLYLLEADDELKDTQHRPTLVPKVSTRPCSLPLVKPVITTSRFA